MKTLNDRITITADIDFDGVVTGKTYPYFVYVEDFNQNGTLLFAGNFFCDSFEHTFDITEIVMNNTWIPTQTVMGEVPIISKYYIKFRFGDATYYTDSVDVAKVYPYPNFTYKNNSHPNSLFGGSVSRISPLRQGFNPIQNDDLQLLVPRYPLFPNSQDFFNCEYPLGVAWRNTNTSTRVMVAVMWFDGVPLGYKQLPANVNHITGAFLTQLQNVADTLQMQWPDNMTEDVGLFLVDDTTQSLAATFEVCPSKYYLFWQDRFGSFQSQPFLNAKYGESFDNVEVINWYGERRKANINVQPKFTLNSGWIDEKVFPFYESIFTSPVLKLLDTESMQTFDVIVEGEYVEKKKKFEKKLLSLTLELSVNKKQNILY